MFEADSFKMTWNTGVACKTTRTKLYVNGTSGTQLGPRLVKRLMPRIDHNSEVAIRSIMRLNRTD